MYTTGIACCIGIHLQKSPRMSLAHTASFMKNDTDKRFLSEGLEWVGKGSKVTIITNPNCTDNIDGDQEGKDSSRRDRAEYIENLKAALVSNKDLAPASIKAFSTRTGHVAINRKGLIRAYDVDKLDKPSKTVTVATGKRRRACSPDNFLEKTTKREI